MPQGLKNHPQNDDERSRMKAAYLPLADLEAGGIYRIKSRNLAFGVWLPDAMNGTGGFSGIREKFYYRSLFTEYHHDTGGCFGTAQAIEKVGQFEGELVEHYSGCKVCREPTDFDADRGETADERWCHVDKSLDADHQAESCYRDNKDMRAVLEAIELAESERLREAGELWKGNGHHHFILTEVMGEPREVTADEYFDAQRIHGVCMGVHHFDAGGVDGAVHLDYERPSL